MPQIDAPMWNRINPIALESSLSDETRMKVEKVNEQINGLLKGRESLDSDRKRLNDATFTSLDEKILNLAKRFKDREVKLLQQEASIRAEIDDAFDAMAADLRTAFDKATVAAKQVVNDVRKALVNIGYADVPYNQPHPSKITQEMILRHPTVRAANDHAKEVRGKSIDASRARENREQLANVRERLVALVTG